MKKIYATMATIALCAASSQAAINVTLDGIEIPDNGTVTVNRSQFNHLYYPGIMDQWMGKVDIEVEAPAQTQVKLTSTAMDIMFCPVGQSCYTLNDFDNDNIFEGEGVLTDTKTTISVDMNYYDMGENLPEEVQKMTAVFTAPDKETFTVNFVFDTNDDSAVEGIAADNTVNVWSISGLKVLDNAPAESLSTLPVGLYIVNGKKVVVK